MLPVAPQGASHCAQVRLSALHAVKRLCKLRPVLLSASTCGFARTLLPGVLNGLQDKRHVHIMMAAQRTMMHVLRACGDARAPRVPTEQLSADVATSCADFLKGSTHRRIKTLESEAEISDDDP